MAHDPSPTHDTQLLATLCWRYGWSWTHITRRSRSNKHGYLICRHNKHDPDYFFVPSSQLEAFALAFESGGDTSKWVHYQWE